MDLYVSSIYIDPAKHRLLKKRLAANVSSIFDNKPDMHKIEMGLKRAKLGIRTKEFANPSEHRSISVQSLLHPAVKIIKKQTD
jgi:hypothetical protein